MTSTLSPAGRVLIIDDDDEVAAGVRMLLESDGYSVTVLPSPLSLAFTLRRFDPDVILLDLGIPTLGGDTILRLDRQRLFPTTASIILFSGRGREELAGLAEEFAVDGFFSKEDDVADLLLRIPKWVAARRGREDSEERRAVMKAAVSADLQPVVVLRTESASRAASALQLGGYVVVKAGTDELAFRLADSCAAGAIVVDLGLREMNRFATAHVPRLGLPALFLSPLPPIQKVAVPAVTLPKSTPRETLLSAIDRLVYEGERMRRAASPSPADAPGASSAAP